MDACVLSALEQSARECFDRMQDAIEEAPSSNLDDQSMLTMLIAAQNYFEDAASMLNLAKSTAGTRRASMPEPFVFVERAS
jgi:acetyl/propionyl-CoA carboxylase alpha subunit